VCLFQVEVFSSVKSALVTDRATTFADCVRWARLLFQDNYHNSIKQLLFNFPADSTTSSGQLFWSGPKRCPTPLIFDTANETHVDFVVAAANLRAYMFGLKENRNQEEILDMLKSVQVPVFTPKAGVKIAVTEAEAESADGENCE